MAEWQAKVKTLSTSDYDTLIISSYANLKDQNGQQIPANSTAEWTSANSAIPVFAFWRFSVGKGKALGGLLLSGLAQGDKAAKATKLLKLPIQF